MFKFQASDTYPLEPRPCGVFLITGYGAPSQAMVGHTALEAEQILSLVNRFRQNASYNKVQRITAGAVELHPHYMHDADYCAYFGDSREITSTGIAAPRPVGAGEIIESSDHSASSAWLIHHGDRSMIIVLPYEAADGTVVMESLERHLQGQFSVSVPSALQARLVENIVPAGWKLTLAPWPA